MKKYLLFLLLNMCAFSLSAQQKEAKEVLDKTSESVKKAGGVKADFEIKAFHKGQLEGEISGSICLKGEMFTLVTREILTWYDGVTLWSYLTHSDEVNISNPTEEDIQGLNPYSLLSIYQSGYAYKLGSVKNYQGKAVTEVVLTATAGQEFAKINLYVNRNDYQPVYMEVELKDGTKNEIAIKDYQSKLNFPDDVFRFNKSDYPNAEIIDLR